MRSNEGLYRKLRIHSITEAAPGFAVVRLERPDNFTYKAGQYITLVRYYGNKEFRRSYSLLSAPETDKDLAIGVKRIDNGMFSRYLTDRAKPGEELLTIGAGGFFTLPDNMAPVAQIFFFAAGSGITPIYALIKSVLNTYPDLKIVLVYSNQSPATTAFTQELNALVAAYASQLRIEFLYGNNPDLLQARLHRDRIFKLLEQYAPSNRNRILCYVCGPENYMRMCLYSLTEAGIPEAHVKREHFVPSGERKPLPAPPDKEPHVVHLTLGTQHFDFEVKYPESILAAGKKAGISLPYSCETGKCGSCVARLSSGEVWHSYNEVLTDSELQKGLILTCVGHPINGDIRLKV